MPDITAQLGNAETLLLGRVQHPERLAQQQLAFQRRTVAMQPSNRQGHAFPYTFGESLGGDGAAQRLMRDAPVERGLARVAHDGSSSGIASSSARMPCPQPPLGRAGRLNELQE